MLSLHRELWKFSLDEGDYSGVILKVFWKNTERQTIPQRRKTAKAIFLYSKHGLVLLGVAFLVVVVACHYYHPESHPQDHQTHCRDHQHHHQDPSRTIISPHPYDY